MRVGRGDPGEDGERCRHARERKDRVISLIEDEIGDDKERLRVAEPYVGGGAVARRGSATSTRTHDRAATTKPSMSERSGSPARRTPSRSQLSTSGSPAARYARSRAWSTSNAWHRLPVELMT